MPYNNIVDRASDAAALIPEDVADTIMQGVQEKSATLRLFRHRTMSRAQQRIPVLSLLPIAYFVTGDTGLKQTTEANWTNSYLNAEEIAVIVPISQNVLDDVDYDLWAEVKPLLEEAIAIALDDAVFFGINKPASWPTAVVPSAVSAGNQVIAGTSTVDTAEDINQVFAAVEADGYIPTGGFGRMALRAFLRGLRDANKGFLYPPNGPANVGLSNNEGPPVIEAANVYSVPTYLSRGGFAGFATGAANYSAVFGDFSQGILGIRKDIEFTIHTEGVIQDNTNAIIYNLLQQDMAALRAVCRFGWQVPNPVNRMQPTAGSRYPFGVLRQRAATGGE